MARSRQWEWIYDKWFNRVFDQDSNDQINLSMNTDEQTVEVYAPNAVVLNMRGISELRKQLQAAERRMKDA